MKTGPGRLALWVSLVSAALSGASDAAEFIVRDGKPRAEIVVLAQAAPTVRLAAEQLQRSVREMTGAELPLVTAPGAASVKVYVGRSRYTEELGIKVDDLGHGAYRMVSGKGWLVLAGRDIPFYQQRHKTAVEMLRLAARRTDNRNRAFWERWYKLSGGEWGVPYNQFWKDRSRKYGVLAQDEAGTFNAVAAFLRMQGMRWYLPGPLGRVVPKKRDILLPKVSKTVRPDFPVRFARVRFSRANTTLWCLWMGINRAPDVIDATFQGHGICAITQYKKGMWCHPRAKPEPVEYYALYGAHRNITGRFAGKQCLSSEGLFEENVRFCRAVFDVFDAPMVSVMPADGFTAICQCEKCKGKASPELGFQGSLSNHVWDYVNRVAKEVYKTHPDRFITNCSYGTYRVPPSNIDKFSPNVVVNFCQHRTRYGQRLEAKKEYTAWRRGFAEKLPKGRRQIFTWEYYRVPNGVPAFSPHAIAEDLRSMRDVSLGDKVDVRFSGRKIEKGRWDSMRTCMAVHHLNLYVTGRFWWDADQDVDALLDEYYTQYYGPAAAEMKTLVTYAEANWLDVLGDEKKMARVLAMVAAAQAKVEPDSVYGKRLALLAMHTDPLKNLRDQLDFKRVEGPELRPVNRDRKDIRLDGKLDDPFWRNMPGYARGVLRECQTGRKPVYRTSFKAAWADGCLYLAIRCEDRGKDHVRNTATEHDHTSIWKGDCVEIHLEPPGHRFYQIAISPAGAIVDLDRKPRGGLRRWLPWSSNAEAATSIDDKGWSVEVRIPAAGEEQAELLPLSGVAGNKPLKAFPWYFNIFRQRLRDEGNSEYSAFSPPGKKGFGHPERFAKMYLRK